MKIKILEDTIVQFCKEFIDNPYNCYTEHGQHALFYAMLKKNYEQNSIQTDHSYNEIGKGNVSIIQKEYPTFDDLGKPRRQNWDIALIKTPFEPGVDKIGSVKEPPYDYLQLDAVVEFGLNENIEHLVDDFLRVSHPLANTDNGYIVHLYRLSGAGKQNSGRDWSPNAKDINDWIVTQKMIPLLNALSSGHIGGIKKALSMINNDISEDELIKRGFPEDKDIVRPVKVAVAFVDVTGSMKDFIYMTF